MAAVDSRAALDISSLFQSFAIGTCVLRSRVVMAPMTRCHSPDGIPGAGVAAYHGRRARGGVGLIITEGTYIDHPGAAALANVPHIHGKARSTAGGAWSTRSTKRAAGSPASCCIRAPCANAAWPPDPGVLGFEPSEMRENDVVTVKAMSADDIEATVDAYARGAVAAQAIGFDGVGIHGAQGYLSDTFFWKRTNLRDDAYGGRLEHRIRFVAEVVIRMRGAVGPSFPIVFRFSQWKRRTTPRASPKLPKSSNASWCPASMCSMRARSASWEPAFPGSDRTLVAWARVLTARGVIAVGSVGLDRPHESSAFRTDENAKASPAGFDAAIKGLADGSFDLWPIRNGPPRSATDAFMISAESKWRTSRHSTEQPQTNQEGSPWTRSYSIAA